MRTEYFMTRLRDAGAKISHEGGRVIVTHGRHRVDFKEFGHHIPDTDLPKICAQLEPLGFSSHVLTGKGAAINAKRLPSRGSR